MKTLIGIIAILVIIGFVLWLSNRDTAQDAPAENDQTSAGDSVDMSTPESGIYQVDAEQSTITWTAEKPAIIGYTHHGTFAVQEGTVDFNPERATGTLVLDMTALQVESLGGGKAGNESRLESHLKSGDFFEVETYPTATLEITNMEETGEQTYLISGDLTIKDTTEEIQFPATLYESNGTVHLQADFEIDRTRWGIQFGSASFFDNLAENAISDMVRIELDVVAQ